MSGTFYIDNPRLWWADPRRTTMQEYTDDMCTTIAGVIDDFGTLHCTDFDRRWYSMNA